VTDTDPLDVGQPAPVVSFVGKADGFAVAGGFPTDLAMVRHERRNSWGQGKRILGVDKVGKSVNGISAFALVSVHRTLDWVGNDRLAAEGT
jgi:hypothetical protein